MENLDFLEKGKEVGRMWGEADEATKQVYAKMALQDKSRYRDEMGRYVPSAAYLQKVNAPPRLEKDPDAPAKARTPYRTRTPALAPTLGNRNHCTSVAKPCRLSIHLSARCVGAEWGFEPPPPPPPPAPPRYRIYCDHERPKLVVAIPHAVPARIKAQLSEGWKKLGCARSGCGQRRRSEWRSMPVPAFNAHRTASRAHVARARHQARGDARVRAAREAGETGVRQPLDPASTSQCILA